MNKKNEAFRSMCEKVLEDLKDDIAIWTGNKLLEGAVTVIRQKCDKIDEYEEIQDKVVKGWQEKKAILRDGLNTKTVVIYGIVRSYALSVNDTVLYVEFETTPTKIKKLNDTTMGARAKSTIKIMDKYKNELLQVGLTNELYDEYSSETTDYLAVIVKPEEVIAKQRMATENIDKLIKELREILTKQLDTYMLPYMLSNPDFYSSYIFSRIIYDNPSGHYSLVGLIRDEETKQALKGVKIYVKQKDGTLIEMKKTGNKGNYIFKKLPAGFFDIFIEFEGYDTLQLSQAIHDGQTSRLDAEIRKTE